MHSADETDDAIFFILVSVAVGTLAAHHLSMLRLPHSVLMFVWGLEIGFLGLMSGKVRLYLNLADSNPEVLFTVFLPVLIFDGAFALNPFALKKSIWQAVLLAGPGLLVNTAMLAGFVKLFYPDWNIYQALLFGSLLSATDPVAVVAVLKDLGVDAGITTVIDGEAIMNDGAAIVCFVLFAPSAGPGVLQGTASDFLVKILVLLAGSFIFGRACGLLTLYLVQRSFLSPVIVTMATVVGAYLAYYTAESVIGTSGVLTLFWMGTFMAKNAAFFWAMHEVHYTWGLIVHIANTLLFIIVGIIVAVHAVPLATRWDVLVLLLLYGAITVARAVMLALFHPVLNKVSDYKLDRERYMLLVHGALRGGVAMVLSVAIHERNEIPQSVRSKILFLTGGIVFLTITINAPTAKRIVTKLGLDAKSPLKMRQMEVNSQGVCKVMKKTIEKHCLKETAVDFGTLRTVTMQKFLNPYTNSFPNMNNRVEFESSQCDELAMQAMTERLWNRRWHGSLSALALLQMMPCVDEAIDESRLLQASDLSLFSRKPFIKKIFDFLQMESYSRHVYRTYNRAGYEALVVFCEVLQDVKQALNVYNFPLEESERILHWMQESKDTAARLIAAMDSTDAKAANTIRLRRAVRSVLDAGLSEVDRQHVYDGITAGDKDALRNSLITVLHREEFNLNHELFIPHDDDVFASCSLWEFCDRCDIQTLLNHSVERVHAKGEMVYTGNSLIVVLEGFLKDEDSFVDRIVGPGDWSAACCALCPLRSPQGRRMTALTRTRTFWLDGSKLQEVAAYSAHLKSRVWHSVGIDVAIEEVRKLYPFSTLSDRDFLQHCDRGSVVFVSSTGQVPIPPSFDGAALLIDGQGSLGFIQADSTDIIPYHTLTQFEPDSKIFLLPAVPGMTRGSELTKAYDVAKYACHVPMVNAGNINLTCVVESLAKTVEVGTRAEILHALDTMLSVAQMHCLVNFTCEEALLTHFRHPQADDHRKQHVDFERMIRIMTLHRCRDVTSLDVKPFLESIKIWMANHFALDKAHFERLAQSSSTMHSLNTPDMVIAATDLETAIKGEIGERHSYKCILPKSQ